MNQPLWQPSGERIARGQHDGLRARGRGAAWRRSCATTRRLRAWSVEQSADFWAELWRFAEVRASRPWDRVLEDGERMPGARWFAGAELNFAENLLRHRDDHPAMIAWSEDGRRRSAELCRAVRAGGAAGRGPEGRWRRSRRSGRRGHAAHPRDHHRHAGRPPRSARSGRPARPTSASRACSTASARSRPRC